MLEIKSLLLENKNQHKNLTNIKETKNSYDINLSIDYNTKIGIYSQDTYTTDMLLRLIAGINKPNKNSKITIGKRSVYDNKEYFENRLYLDFSKLYLSTLNPSKIDEALNEKFATNLDKEKFSKISKDLNIRGECEILDKYYFSLSGNTLVNFALAASLDYKFLIINNPTLHINNNSSKSNELEYVVDYFNKNYKSLIFGLNDLGLITTILDYIIILDDFGFTHIIHHDSILYVINAKDLTDEITKYKMFISKDEERIILSSEISKEEIKALKKKKIEVVAITPDLVGGYL